jgi:hypothetical protein
MSLESEDEEETNFLVDFFRSYLKEVVTIHHVMFEKLLFQGKGIPLELAELFEDAGNTYLECSERISEEFHKRRS